MAPGFDSESSSQFSSTMLYVFLEYFVWVQYVVDVSFQTPGVDRYSKGSDVIGSHQTEQQYVDSLPFLELFLPKICFVYFCMVDTPMFWSFALKFRHLFYLFLFTTINIQRGHVLLIFKVYFKIFKYTTKQCVATEYKLFIN